MTDWYKYLRQAPDLKCNRNHSVRVWWLPVDFNQTCINGRLERDGKKSSNACTIICILMAQRIFQHDIRIFGQTDQPLNKHLITSFAECIADGNTIHEKLLRNGQLQHMNLTVPEALKACSNKTKYLYEWYYVQKSLIYLMPMRQCLYDNLHNGITQWQTDPPPYAFPDLYIILIADSRSVLLVYQQELDRVTLLDSHSHMHSGSVIAQVDLEQLQDLCCWYDTICGKIFGTRPDCFELSFLYFKNCIRGNDLRS